MRKAMTSSIFSDDFKPDPYWWDDTPRPENGEEILPEKVDVLIIGSGYTGLNCAIETARAGRETLVIDSQAIGWGCSSRNGGQISGEIKPGYDELNRRYGKDKAFAMVKEARNALAWIQAFIGSEKIDCDLRQCGRYMAAHNPRQFQQLLKDAEIKFRQYVPDYDYFKYYKLKIKITADIKDVLKTAVIRRL